MKTNPKDRFFIIYVVGCSVNGLDYYYPCQWAKLFGEVGSAPVFESGGRGFDFSSATDFPQVLDKIRPAAVVNPIIK